MKRILVWGGGGHGKVVADVARAVGWEVAGVIDSDPRKLGATVDPGGGRVVMLQSDFLKLIREAGSLPEDADAVALGIGDNQTRVGCFDALHGILAPPLIHPTAAVSPSARIGRGTVVMPRAVVNAGARVGEAAIINTGAVVEHDCDVMDAAHLATLAAIGGGCTIGSGSLIGAGATVLPGLKVGVDTIVGAGATVIENVEDGVVVAGVPARFINFRRSR